VTNGGDFASFAVHDCPTVLLVCTYISIGTSLRNAMVLSRKNEERRKRQSAEFNNIRDLLHRGLRQEKRAIEELGEGHGWDIGGNPQNGDHLVEA
jgi:hypothetical protein